MVSRNVLATLFWFAWGVIVRAALLLSWNFVTLTVPFAVRLDRCGVLLLFIMGWYRQVELGIIFAMCGVLGRRLVVGSMIWLT